MVNKTIAFGSAGTRFIFDGSIDHLETLANGRRIVVLTDDNVFNAHKRKFKWFDTIVMPAGESYKVQATVDIILEQLMAYEADRQTLLVGAGGGVVTDMAGFVAAIYMRGIAVGFVP
ncbi:MAG TPA: hypothetical protein VK907_05730, partial [Phnomibacter sp.]|nr:hypothetical protein [Phnomibacter sp.]